MLNHATIPANQLTALAKELLHATEGNELNEQVAETLLEAAHLAQSAAGKRQKEEIVQSPLMSLPAVLQKAGHAVSSNSEVWERRMKIEQSYTPEGSFPGVR